MEIHLEALSMKDEDGRIQVPTGEETKHSQSLVHRNTLEPLNHTASQYFGRQLVARSINNASSQLDQSLEPRLSATLPGKPKTFTDSRNPRQGS